MTQHYIRIAAGEYRGNKIVDEVFPLIKPFQLGAKGGFVTVNGSQKFERDSIRVKVDGVTAYEFVTEQDYFNQGGTLVECAEPTAVKFTQPVKQETDEEVVERIRERFEILDEMTKAAISGDIRAMIVSGPPGVGKSFGVEQQIDKAVLFDQLAGRKLRAEVVKGSTSAIGLYCTLYKYSDANSVLVFDDADSVFFDDVSLNLLKGALDSGKKRKISWLADSNTLRREGVPDSFNFKGSVIFITNLKFQNVKSNKLKDHLAALESRCHYIDLKLDTVREKLLRIRQIVGDGMLDEYDFEDSAKDEIVNFLHDNAAKLREISLRTVIKTADLRKAFPNRWQALASTTLMKSED